MNNCSFSEIKYLSGSYYVQIHIQNCETGINYYTRSLFFWTKFGVVTSFLNGISRLAIIIKTLREIVQSEFYDNDLWMESNKKNWNTDETGTDYEEALRI